MRYIIRYTNPNNVTVREYSKECPTRGQVNAFVKKARQYPGSCRIISITKVSAAGQETPVAW